MCQEADRCRRLKNLVIGGDSWVRSSRLPVELSIHSAALSQICVGGLNYLLPLTFHRFLPLCLPPASGEALFWVADAYR